MAPKTEKNKTTDDDIDSLVGVLSKCHISRVHKSAGGISKTTRSETHPKKVSWDTTGANEDLKYRMEQELHDEAAFNRCSARVVYFHQAREKRIIKRIQDINAQLDFSGLSLKPKPAKVCFRHLSVTVSAIRKAQCMQQLTDKPVINDIRAAWDVKVAQMTPDWALTGFGTLVTSGTPAHMNCFHAHSFSDWTRVKGLFLCLMKKFEFEEIMADQAVYEGHIRDHPDKDCRMADTIIAGAILSCTKFDIFKGDTAERAAFFETRDEVDQRCKFVIDYINEYIKRNGQQEGEILTEDSV